MSVNDQQPDSTQKSFVELWVKSQNTLGGYIDAHVPDHAMAEDILQEVARKATIHFEQYDHSNSFIAWLIAIARQRIADAYRTQKRRPLIISSDVVASFERAFIQLEPEENIRAEHLKNCVELLSDRHRRLIEMRYGRELSSCDIAEQIGGNSRSIDSMLYRIREALRQCINRKMEFSP